MTVEELIKALKRLPKKLPVHHCAAPWGSPYEIEKVEQTTVGSTHTPKSKWKKVVLLDDNVGV